MIDIQNLSFSRGGKTLFRDSSLSLFPGNKVGLIGPNGSGKSSFLALLLKQALPDTGEIVMSDKFVISHMAQEIDDLDREILDYALQGNTAVYRLQQEIRKAEATRDNDKLVSLYAQFDALDSYDNKHKAEQLLTGLGFKPSQFAQPVASLSGGWQMRLNLAKALLCPADILLLDEPTNHLDLDSIFWLEDFLTNFSGTLILISHDREFLDAVTNKILSIESQQLTLYNGNYSGYESPYAARLQQQESQARKNQQRAEELTRFINRFKSKASKAKQAQSRIKALNKLNTVVPLQTAKGMTFSFQAPMKLPHNMLQLEDVHFGYDDHEILTGIDFKLFAENRIGILGVNGAGKSTLIKLIVGQIEPLLGTRQIHKDLAIGYFAQDFLAQLDSTAVHWMRIERLFPKCRTRKFAITWGNSASRTT